MGNKTNLFAGLLQGYTQATQQKKDRMERDEMKKLQIKMFKDDLERKEKEESALSQIFKQMKGVENLPPDFTGPPQETSKKSLLDILADPQGQGLLMQAGMKPQDIISAGRKSTPFDISQLPPGMVLGGVKVTPSGEPMYDFEVPEIDKWVPSKTGLEMIGLDRQGREISRREAGPDERPKPSDEDKKKKELASALDVYEKAKQGLIGGLEGTTTAPVLGKLPAITSSQQIAQGSVAAMAPVLKQLFRAAGEGVFTDRDQQLLLEMIPTRETNPKAREAMIQNIDAIVRAKLGQQAKTEKVIDFSELP